MLPAERLDVCDVTAHAQAATLACRVHRARRRTVCQGPCLRGASSPPSAQSRPRQHCPLEVRHLPPLPACASCDCDAAHAHGCAPLGCSRCACPPHAYDAPTLRVMARLEAEKWECCRPQRRGQANRPLAQLHRRPGPEAHAGACVRACEPPRRRRGALPRVGVSGEQKLVSAPAGRPAARSLAPPYAETHTRHALDLPGGRPGRQPCIHCRRVHAARRRQAGVLWQEVAGWAGQANGLDARWNDWRIVSVQQQSWRVGCATPSGPARVWAYAAPGGGGHRCPPAPAGVRLRASP